MKNVFWILLIFLVIFRYFTTRPVYKNGDHVRITGVVYSDPIIYETSQYLHLGGLKFYLPKIPEIYYGDKIIVEGVVDNGKLKSVKLVEKISEEGFMSGFRNKIIEFYGKVLPQPMSGLAAGTTLGSKGALTNDFWEKVKKTGVAHVVVASGTNVTFVVSFLVTFLTIFMKRKKALYFATVGILIYLFISGFDAPLVRAALMAGLTFLSEGFGRVVSAWRVLFITALGMLIYRPDWVVDLGFILSFVSTASLMLFEKRNRLRLSFVPEFLKEGLSTSLAAQIGVSPILFVTFGQFNIWSPIINALVLWTIPYIMIFSAAGGVLALLVPVLGKVVTLLGYPFLWWFTSIVTLFNF